MCGIYGFIGRDSVDKTLQGLQKLEYRGYDSAGIAYKKIDKNNNNKIVTIKAVGQISNLLKLAKNHKSQSSVCIGHTRWATHGKPNKTNCHPHQSHNKQWAVVHNGIIENFAELILKFNLQPKSQTDTEVIVLLIEKLYNNNILQTISDVCNLLKGSYTICVYTTFDENCIYVAKQNNPAVIGVSDDSCVVCSDITSIEEYDKIYTLNSFEYAKLDDNGVVFFDKQLNKLNKKQIEVTKQKQHNKTDYKHFMLKEIFEIPQSIKNTVGKFLQSKLPSDFSNVKNIIVIGCGTAYNSGLIAKWLFEEHCNISCQIASEFIYKKQYISQNTVAILISQSGETADTINAIKLCKKLNIQTIVITNVQNSTLATLSDYVLNIDAGKEVAVASTKAYNCQVACLHLLHAYYLGDKQLIDTSKQLIEFADNLNIDDYTNISKQISKKIKKHNNIFLIGRGIDFDICLEAGLKIKEITYKMCDCYPAGELKHGTISLIDKNKFIFCLNTQQHLLDKTIGNLYEVMARGGKVCFLTDSKTSHKNSVEILKTDFAVLSTIIYFQLIAYYTSVNAKINPDKPRSLAKSVTVE